MKVAQLVGVWVLALAVGVIAAALAWTTWLDIRPQVTDAERVWCTNNLPSVMLAAGGLGIAIPEEAVSTIGDAIPESTSPADETDNASALRDVTAVLVQPWFFVTQEWVLTVAGEEEPSALTMARVAWAVRHDFLNWRDSVLGEDATWPEVWSTAPFDRLCRAAFEGR